MRRSTSISPDNERKSRYARNKDEVPSTSRIEDDSSKLKVDDYKQRRRQEWWNQQKLEREHEKLKEKKILEYEVRRARELGLPLPKNSLQHRGCSKSRSTSPGRQHRIYSSTSSSKPKISILSEQIDPTSGITPIFKGPEGTEIRSTVLHQIKVNIHRIIPTKAVSTELQRDIVNPEDVVLKRRDGEGSKPIFERDEIRGVAQKAVEVEELRTVVNIERKPQTSKRRSVSSSPPRRRSHYSPRSSSSRSRHDEIKRKRDYDERHRDRSKNRSRDRSLERKRVYSMDNIHHGSSRSGEGHRRKSQSDSRRSRSSPKDDRYHREFHRRQSPGDRRGGDSRERRVMPPTYMEQVPVPLYYGNFIPRPIMVPPPMVPFRGSVPMLRGRHPPMMGPVRPFTPRFMHPDMYRLGPGPSRGILPPW